MWRIGYLNREGCTIHARKSCRSSVSSLLVLLLFSGLMWPMLGTVHRKISCLTHQACIPNIFTLPESVEVGTFAARQRDIRGHDDLQGTFSLTLVFPAIMTPPMDRHSTCQSVEAINLRQNIKTTRRHTIRFPQTYTIWEIWFENILCRFVSVSVTVKPFLLYMGQKYHGFGFMETLIADMVQDDPTKRPKMDEVVTRFREIKGKLSSWKLRSRIARRKEIWVLTVWRFVGHWYRTIGYVLGRKAAIPEPKWTQYYLLFGLLVFLLLLLLYLTLIAFTMLLWNIRYLTCYFDRFWSVRDPHLLRFTSYRA